MPALAFGLNTSKPRPNVAKPTQKRKNLFGEDENDEDSATKFNGVNGPEQVSTIGGFGDDNGDDSPRQRKSPKLSLPTKPNIHNQAQKYANLSALHSAKLQDARASEVDKSIYDYDAVYETFHVPKAMSKSNDAASGPKYMTSLLASADVRKRDQLRAKEKQLQREREKEGDEFADKEKFVTGAYKQQQEDVKRLEEEEARKEAEEEEKRRKGGRMTEWHKEVLRKEDERMKLIEKAAEEVARGQQPPTRGGTDDTAEKSESKMAAEMNEKGAHVIINDEGEVVDKRQLLSAGLNVATKSKASTQDGDKSSASTLRDGGYQRSTAAQTARQSQRDRQTRMLETQMEEMTQKARQAEEEEQRQKEEKARSTKTDADKIGARERFLARKREREEEARVAKEKPSVV